MRIHTRIHKHEHEHTHTHTRPPQVGSQPVQDSQAQKIVATGELLTSVRRYWSNSFTDRAKQDSINLFLGRLSPLLLLPLLLPPLLLLLLASIS